MGLLSKVTKSIKKVVNPVSNLVGDTINGLTGVNSQMDKSYQQQTEAMNAQNAYNTQMWNLQNQYNSPVAQLARMAEAGIDINPISYALGTGNLSNTAALVGSAGGFAGNGSPAGNPISMLMGMASGIQGVKESKARVENMDVQHDNIVQQTNATKLENDIRRHNLNYAENHNLPVGSMPGTDASLAGFMNEAGQNGVWNTIKKYWNKNI